MTRRVLVGAFAGLLSCAATAGAAETADAWQAVASGNTFIDLLFVFVLATFIGMGVITRMSRLLHTPLMSLTNAISAIAIVGSLIITGERKDTFSLVLGAIAVAASMTNIVSGFLITDRMLKMFKEKKPAAAAEGPHK